jgi:hypothetical protein
MSAPAIADHDRRAGEAVPGASALLTTLNEVVPASTIHFAVEDTRRALQQLIASPATLRTSDTLRTTGEGS